MLLGVFSSICILNRYWYIIRTFSILSYTNFDISLPKFVYDNYIIWDILNSLYIPNTSIPIILNIEG